MSSRYIIRYGATRIVAEFTVHDGQLHPRSSQVVVRSERGMEWGEILCPSSESARKAMGNRDARGRVIRKASDDDFRHHDDVRRRERVEFDGCNELIKQHKLQMQLVDVEHLFGGERIIFYYLAEQRVDFRELVKALAQQYKTRIEMRQIGVRDEAKLLADFGDCGKPVCCNTHLRSMPPVAMKMAKLQKATLDPNKISGRCGRLKCCLRFEYDTYEEFRRELPRAGSTVVTRTGQGRVLAQEILARKILVAFEDKQTALVDLSDVVTVISGNSGGGKQSPRKNKDQPDKPKNKPSEKPVDPSSAATPPSGKSPESDRAE
ncbi:MAG: signal peptidase [Planctomycetaceae bacterium]|jgi:cell fate regulator YaaT (PSP1 superfamily)|nr:signal peptidase [Planctomycetaceae bacterium]MDP7275026.1 regulatory iron-sulfur-containing complex subunit RicT [Planctomycetaceae bacterium]